MSSISIPDIIIHKLDSLKEASHVLRRPIELDITFSATEHITEAYVAMEYILETCKDSVGRISIVMVDSDGLANHVVVYLGQTATFALPKLRQFSWTGDIGRHLPKPWCSLSNLPFSQLETLELNCTLSLGDCIQILLRCGNITKFTIHSIQNCSSLMPVVHTVETKILRALKGLEITSIVDLRLLCDYISFPSLRSVDFDFPHGTNQHIEMFPIWASDLNHIGLP